MPQVVTINGIIIAIGARVLLTGSGWGSVQNKEARVTAFTPRNWVLVEVVDPDLPRHFNDNEAYIQGFSNAYGPDALTCAYDLRYQENWTAELSEEWT